MNLVESKIGDVCVLTIEGDVDAGTAPDLEDHLHALIQSAERELVLDLDAVPYVSSAFLRVVLIAARDIRQRRGDLRLVSLQHSVRAVFDLAGFSELFKIYDDVQAAVVSYRG
jgi:stage II sporulation protein AA (anti-sigma F factor antagonist)